LKRAICHDCKVKEGELHVPGCDMERCPFCGGQLISCACRYKLLGYAYDWDAEYCGLPKEIYKNGLPEEKEKIWLDSLKGIRVPWIQYPNICIKCGELWPEMFSVPDQEWRHYIQKNEQKEVLCRDCYKFIKEVIDSKDYL